MKPMKRPFVVLFAVAPLVIALLGLRAWTSSRRPSHSPGGGDTSDTDAQLSELRAEVAILKDQQTREGRALAASLAAPKPAEAAPVENAPTSAETAAKVEARNARIADLLTHRVETERVDAAWSAKTSELIKTGFQGALPGTEVVDARCASTLCRVVVRHPEKGDQVAMPEKLSRVQPFAQGTFFRYDMTSDPPVTTLYVLRDGQIPPEAKNLD